jgi:hypothetical protein
VHARGADRVVGLAVAPGASEGVGDQHADLDPEAAAKRGGEAAGGRVGVLRQKEDRAVRGVGGVDAGGRRHHAEPVLHDARDAAGRAGARGDDAHRLGGDRVLAVVGGDDASLGLRDDLRRHHEDVAVGERVARRLHDDVGQVGAGHDLGDALEGPDGQRGGRLRHPSSLPDRATR